MPSLPPHYRALVIGASGAIGSAFVQQLRADPRCAQVRALGRSSTPRIDLDDEASVAQAARALAGEGPLHLVIHAAGLLHGAHGLPEKRLAQLNYAQLEHTFRTNTFGPALVLAHFAPLLDRQRSVLAVLSAKVGSIGDNRLGGWYSYRASKAALNMYLHTLAYETPRRGVTLVMLHPGLVGTNPGLSRFPGALKTADSVGQMLTVIDRLTPADNGRFLDYRGETLPW